MTPLERYCKHCGSENEEWVLVHEDEIDGTELRMYAKEPITSETIIVHMQKTGENFTKIKPFSSRLDQGGE